MIFSQIETKQSSRKIASLTFACVQLFINHTNENCAMCVRRDVYCDVISGRVALGVWYTNEAYREAQFQQVWD